MATVYDMNEYLADKGQTSIKMEKVDDMIKLLADKGQTSIQFSNLRLNQQNIEALVKSLNGNQTLTSLELSYVAIDNYKTAALFVEAVAELLAKNSKLTHLGLHIVDSPKEPISIPLMVNPNPGTKKSSSKTFDSDDEDAGSDEDGGNVSYVNYQEFQGENSDEDDEASSSQAAGFQGDLSYGTESTDNESTVNAGNTDEVTHQAIGTQDNSNDPISLSYTPIFQALRKNASLTSLDCQYYYFNSSDVKMLAEALSENTTLMKLNVSSCRLGQKGVTTILEALQHNPNSKLSQLDLSNNHLYFEDSQVIEDAERPYTGMDLDPSVAEELEVKRKENTKIVAETVSNFIKNFPNIRDLDLSKNFFQAEDVMVIVGALAQNNTLASLNLAGSIISEADLSMVSATIQSVLQMNTSLTHFVLFEHDGFHEKFDDIKAFMVSIKTLMDRNISQQLRFTICSGMHRIIGKDSSLFLHLRENPCFEPNVVSMIFENIGCEKKRLKEHPEEGDPKAASESQTVQSNSANTSHSNKQDQQEVKKRQETEEAKESDKSKSMLVAYAQHTQGSTNAGAASATSVTSTAPRAMTGVPTVTTSRKSG